MTASLAPEGLLSFRGFRRMGGSSVIQPEATITEQAPSWLDAARECASLVELERDWDSYGGRPVHQSIAQAATNLILQLGRPGVPSPTVVPTARGGIQLEWHTSKVDLEIEVISPGRLSALFEDHENGQQWEREFDSDLTLLVKAVDRLAEAR